MYSRVAGVPFRTVPGCHCVLETKRRRTSTDDVGVRKGKVTARKVSEVLNAVARLIRAVGVLVDALSKWVG